MKKKRSSISILPVRSHKIRCDNTMATAGNSIRSTKLDTVTSVSCSLEILEQSSEFALINLANFGLTIISIGYQMNTSSCRIQSRLGVT